MMFSQPNVDVAGDLVCIRYGRMWPVAKDASPTGAEQGTWPNSWPTQDDAGAELRGEEVVLRVYPLDYFYD